MQVEVERMLSKKNQTITLEIAESDNHYKIMQYFGGHTNSDQFHSNIGIACIELHILL